MKNMTRFTEVHLLRSFGRGVLQEFFGRFASELKGRGVALPAESLPDDEYFRGLGRLLMSPEGVPDAVHDVLHAVWEMATPEGHAQLKGAVRDSGLTPTWDPTATRADIALRVWLAAPALLARKSNEQQFGRLCTFDYYERNPDGATGELIARRGHLEALERRLDAWCAENDRGEETVVVERFDLNGEAWYLIRHGDTFKRSAKVERRRLEILHYRPAKDDLVVHTPARDELRVNARTRGEKELYRRAFGCFLHGREDHFRPLRHCLSPLRALGREALECEDVPGLSQVRLTRLDLDLSNGRKRLLTLKGEDVFADLRWAGEASGTIPSNAALVRAGFALCVSGFTKPLELQIKPPNTLRLCRHSAAGVAYEWMGKRRFREVRSGA